MDRDKESTERPVAPTDPAVSKSKAELFKEFFDGLQEDLLSSENFERNELARESFYQSLLTFDTSRYPPLAPSSSISLEFKALADSMLNLAHSLGTDSENSAMKQFKDAFQARVNGAAASSMSDCIPFDFTYMFLLCYGLLNTSNTSTRLSIGTGFCAIMDASWEQSHGDECSDCELYWSLKYAEQASKDIKMFGRQGAVSFNMALYAVVSYLTKILQQC